MKTVTATDIAPYSKVQFYDKFDYLPSSLEHSNILIHHSPTTVAMTTITTTTTTNTSTKRRQQ